MAVLAGGLAFVGGAEATELILDGSFENTSPSSNPVVRVGGLENPEVGQGWSFFSTYAYSTLYTLPGPAGSGLQFLRPYASGTYGITQSSETVRQRVSLTEATGLTPAKIDAGGGRYTMSAWFSSYLTTGDFSDVTLQFLDATTNPVAPPVVVGGSNFVASIPTGPNSKYVDAKEWAQDLLSGTIPAGARAAEVTVQSTAVSGAPDGYVDLVSLDVVDAASGTPVVALADPPNNAVGAGPEVNLSLTLHDRTTAVDADSVRLTLDDQLVAATVQRDGTNTVVQYSAGLLPARSVHTYEVVFSDNGTPLTTQTNRFQFTVADYLTLPSNLASPLGSEDATKPGFKVGVYQIASLTGSGAVQIYAPPSIAFSEAMLAGVVGPNIADLGDAEEGNTFVEPEVINWVNLSAGGALGNFPNDQAFWGIPRETGSQDSFANEILTFVRFPTAGYYRMGINNEDQFRLTVAETGDHRTLELVSPSSQIIPAVPIATNITQLQFGGALPSTPLTAPVVYATPSGVPDDACSLEGTLDLTGKIALLDRGGTLCDSAAKAEQAQRAGAVAVIQITPGDTGFPFRLDDINPSVTIPVLVIADAFGGYELYNLLTGGTPVTATIRGDNAPRLAEWDGPKGFGAVDVNFGFAVPSPGLYPFRLVAGQESGAANLEWFSIQPDGTRILLNDTSNPAALRAFRARTFVELPELNLPTVTGSNVNISWSGTGTLEQAGALSGPWNAAPSQANPQAVPATEAAKFYRIRRP